MSEIKITIGGALEAAAAARFTEAWHRAERGESRHERVLSFESWETLTKTLTAKRLELLGYVRRNQVTSVRGLAAALGRDYRNVHADIQALKAAGFLETSAHRIQAPYDTIETLIRV